MTTDAGRASVDYPGFTGETFPEVFTTAPPQPAVKKPGHLPVEKIQEYFQNGFLVVENVFTPGELEPVRDSYRKLVDDLAQKLYTTGRIKNLYEDYGLKYRLLMLEKEWPGAVLLVLKQGKLTPEFRALYQNEKLLDIIEQLVGPDVGANPVWNTRPKTPGHAETDVPWHQDSSYFDKDSYKTLIATAWVPVVDITEENGCMEFCKGGHRKGLVAVHECCDNFYLMLHEEEMVHRLGVNPTTDFVRCPVKAGGLVLFNNMIPHRSIPNQSDHIRWAMDLRFQNANLPWGFYGKSVGILLRSPDKPDHVPDWDFYDGQNRYEIIEKDLHTKTEEKEKLDEFTTFLTGPHMDMWKIVRRSRHTDHHFAEKAKKEEENQSSQP